MPRSCCRSNGTHQVDNELRELGHVSELVELNIFIFVYKDPQILQMSGKNIILFFICSFKYSENVD